MLSRENLHAYQERAITFIQERKRCGLFLDMGLGKTSSALTAISDLRDSFSIHKVLIIAPLRVANSVWAQEAAKWSHLKHLKVSVCTGHQKARLAALQAAADVYVINRENIDWLVDAKGENWPFDMIVIDESSSFKSPSSKRFKALRRILPKTDYMVLLTGTPSPNGLIDLWSQIYLIDFGHALGRTIASFTQRFFEADFMGYKLTLRAGSSDKIHDLIAPNVIHMSAEDYLELPSRIDLIERIELPTAALDGYREFERTMLAELESGTEVEAMTAAVLANKLLQYANGGLYVGDGNWESTHGAKFDALREIVSENPNENLLVAYNYRFDLENLRVVFPDAVVLDKDQETIDRWNRGEIKMLLAHPASAGHGLNLQHGGSVIVWFGLTWSLEYYQQFNARLHRQGQTKPVRILHIVADKTIDDRVLAALSSKDATQRQLLAALKPDQDQDEKGA